MFNIICFTFISARQVNGTDIDMYWLVPSYVEDGEKHVANCILPISIDASAAALDVIVVQGK